MKTIESKNIIKKLLVEVNTNSVTKAMHIKDTIDSFIKNEIYPEIEAILQKYSQEIKNNSIQLNTLVIDINGANYNDIKTSFINQFEKSIKSIAINTFESKETNMSKEEKTVKALLFFLKTGQLPWWYDTQVFFHIEEIKNIKNKPTYQNKIRAVLAKKQVQQRVIYQFSFNQIEALLCAVFKIEIDNNRQLSEKLIYEISKNVNSNFWKILFFAIFNKNHKNIIVTVYTEIGTILKLKSHKNGKGFNMEKSTLSQLVSLVNYMAILTKLPLQIIDNKQGVIALEINENSGIQTVLNENSSFITSKIRAKITTFLPDLGNYKILKNSESSISEESTFDAFKKVVGSTNDKVNKKNYDQVPINTTFGIIKKVEVYSINDEVNLSNENDEILIKKAGLVLLHPFLPQFFTTLGFYKKGEKCLKEAKIHEAVHVLHYLATKNESPYEYELSFEKFLCGIPFHVPIQRLEQISKEQKEECTNLLESVINHWKALKTKNIDTLRSGFLIREGKLTKGSDNTKIYIQRQAHDILLERLPWGISVMNLPWIPHITFIEW